MHSYPRSLVTDLYQVTGDLSQKLEFLVKPLSNPDFDTAML